jgi:hypothetical protein
MELILIFQWNLMSHKRYKNPVRRSRAGAANWKGFTGRGCGGHSGTPSLPVPQPEVPGGASMIPRIRIIENTTIAEGRAPC